MIPRSACPFSLRKGFQAHGLNACLADYPYEKGSPYSEAWIAGWRSAEAEQKELLG